MTDTSYVALLKGVNVGRANRVAMADLRAMLGGLGYRDVRTHLQSGNAAFRASASAADLVAAIEHALVTDLGIEIRVVVRTHRQLIDAVAADPFSGIATEPARHLIGFFSAAPGAATLTAFEQYLAARDPDPEVAGLQQISGDHCYLWCPQGVLKSLFGTLDWGRRLGVTVTMRNWSTALTLVEMSVAD